MANAPESDPAMRIDWVMVPTRGPGPGLSRLLGGLGEGSRIRVLVDDPNPAAAQVVRDEFAHVEVWGSTERRSYERALVEHGAPEAAVRAALHAPVDSPWRVGALRNLILLLGVGLRVVSIDDDVVAEGIARPTGPRRLSGRLSPTRWLAQRSSRDLLLHPLSISSAHGSILGQPAHADDAVVDGADPTVAQPGARVVVSSLGIYGDPGASRTTTLLALHPADRARLLSSLQVHLQANVALRMAQALTITNSPFLMAPCIGLDGSALLPPFLAMHRNTDGIWGRVLTHWVRPGLIAHLPVAVRHAPQHPTPLRIQDLATDVVQFRTSDLMLLVVGAVQPSAPTPHGRLAELAGYMAKIASVPDDHLAGLVEIYSRKWLAGQLSLVRQHLAEGDEELSWRAALLAAEQRLQASLQAPPWPVEYAPKSVDGLRKMFEGFALSLQHWPALRQAAAQLNGTAAGEAA